MTQGTRLPPRWEEIGREVERYLARFFRGRPEVDVADVTQDVLLNLLRRFHTAAPLEDPLALALVVARRRALDVLRRHYASRRFFDNHSGDVLDAAPGAVTGNHPGAPAAIDEVARREVREILLGARARLSPRCRAILDQLLLGLRLSEVAEILGRSAGAVRNRWFECRRHIREALESQGLGRADLLG